jgi:hypothetical protein
MESALTAGDERGITLSGPSRLVVASFAAVSIAAVGPAATGRVPLAPQALVAVAGMLGVTKATLRLLERGIGNVAHAVEMELDEVMYRRHQTWLTRTAVESNLQRPSMRGQEREEGHDLLGIALGVTGSRSMAVSVATKVARSRADDAMVRLTVLARVLSNGVSPRDAFLRLAAYERSVDQRRSAVQAGEGQQSEDSGARGQPVWPVATLADRLERAVEGGDVRRGRGDDWSGEDRLVLVARAVATTDDVEGALAAVGDSAGAELSTTAALAAVAHGAAALPEGWAARVDGLDLAERAMHAFDAVSSSVSDDWGVDLSDLDAEVLR